MQHRHSLQVVAPGKWGLLPKGDFRVYDSAEAIKRGHAAYVIDCGDSVSSGFSAGECTPANSGKK